MCSIATADRDTDPYTGDTFYWKLCTGGDTTDWHSKLTTHRLIFAALGLVLSSYITHPPLTVTITVKRTG